MQIEQDAQIELRIRQIEMAYELDRRLGITVQNNQGQSVLLKLGQFSPEFQGRMNFLEELRAELFSPGNNFTQTELDDYSTAIDKYLFLLDVDCRRSGFVPRVIPDNAEVRFEFANPFRFEME